MSEDRLLIPSVIDPQGCLLISLPCTGCGCDLKTLPVTGFCPQCGRPVRESTEPRLPTIDADGRLLADVPCLNCGYNLRMRLIGELCPECAADVAVSIRSDLLHLAPNTWLKQIAGGAGLLFFTLTACLIFPVFGIFIGFSSAVSGGFPAQLMTFMMFGVCIGIVILVCMILGVLRLTTLEPGAQYRREGFSARKLARLCLIAIGASFALYVVALPLTNFGLLYAPFSSLLHMGFTLFSTVANFTLPLALLWYFAGLMRRIPRPGLVTYCKIEFWSVLACLVLYLVVFPGFMWYSAKVASSLPVAPGPNNPTSPYAVGTSLPATPGGLPMQRLSQLGYINTGGSSSTMTVTTTAGGATTTIVTTAPGTLPPIGKFMAIIAIVYGLVSCSIFVLVIAGYILLILVWRALVATSRVAGDHVGAALLR